MLFNYAVNCLVRTESRYGAIRSIRAYFDSNMRYFDSDMRVELSLLVAAAVVVVMVAVYTL